MKGIIRNNISFILAAVTWIVNAIIFIVRWDEVPLGTYFASCLVILLYTAYIIALRGAGEHDG